MDFILAHEQLFWFCIMTLCIIIETVTFSLTTIWAAISALFMIFLSLTKIPFLVQVLIFLLVAIALVFFTRPFAIKKLHIGKTKTNVESLVGQEVVVTKDITTIKKGEAKTLDGVIWMSKSKDNGNIAKDTICIISEIEGNTLLLSVKK